MNEGRAPPRAVLDAEEAVAAYHDHLTRAKFEIETHRDKTLVLISGGALTVSFAFIATVVEHAGVIRLWWLVAAWISWGGVLILSVVGHTLSVSIYNHVIDAISREDWAAARKRPKRAFFIEPLNVVILMLAVSGFGLFGYFAVGALERIANGQEQTIGNQQSAKSKGGEEVQGLPREHQGQLGTAAPAGVSKGPKEAQGVTR